MIQFPELKRIGNLNNYFNDNKEEIKEYCEYLKKRAIELGPPDLTVPTEKRYLLEGNKNETS